MKRMESELKSVRSLNKQLADQLQNNNTFEIKKDTEVKKLKKVINHKDKTINSQLSIISSLKIKNEKRKKIIDEKKDDNVSEIFLSN